MSYQQQQYTYPNGLSPTGQPTSKPYGTTYNQQYPNQQYPYQQYPYNQPGQYVQPSAPPMPPNIQYPYQQYPYNQPTYGNQYPNYPPPAYNSPYTQGPYPPTTTQSTYKKK